MMGRASVLVLLGLAFLAQGAPMALAQATPAKLLLVEMEGSGFDEATRRGVVDRLERGLARHERFALASLPGGSLVDEMFELECVDLDDECLGKLATKYAAARLLVLSLDRDPAGGALFDVRLFDAAGASSSRFRRMGVAAAELGDMADEALLSLVGEPPPPPKPQKGMVKVTGPAGATVRIGRVAAGELPFEGEVPPGTYPVVVKKEGHKEFVTRVTVTAGALTEVAGELEAIAAEPAPAPEPAAVPVEEVQSGSRPIYKQWWFWTGIAAVVAGGIATTVLLLDQDGGAPTGDLSLSLRPWDVGADPLFNP